MLVLASASPRRRELLSALGLSFRVEASSVDESLLPGEEPLVYVARVAAAKARAYAGPPALVLAADTTVALDGEVFAKPDDDAHAQAMLARLSGRTHFVHTAIALRPADGGALLEQTVTTEVRFRRLSAREIALYVESGEARDKAGAYGIQGRAGGLVATLVGSYTNVVGLPVEETVALLGQAGVEVGSP